MGVGMLVGACGSDGDEPTPKPDDNPQETEVTEQIPDEIPYTHIQLAGECRDLILNALGVGEGPEALAKLNSFNALMARMMP